MPPFDAGADAAMMLCEVLSAGADALAIVRAPAPAIMMETAANSAATATVIRNGEDLVFGMDGPFRRVGGVK